MNQRGENTQQQQAAHAQRQRERRSPERGGDEGGRESVESGLQEALAGSRQATLFGKQIERLQGQAGHGQRHAECEYEDRQHAPRQRWRPGQVEANIEHDGETHHQVAGGDRSRQRQLAGAATRQPGADHQAAHRRAEQPQETGRRNAQVVHQEDRGREHIDEEGGEIERQCTTNQQERLRSEHLPVAADQIAGVQRLAPMPWQRFREQIPGGQPQGSAAQCQEGKHRAPAEPGLQPAAEHRRHRRGHGEHHGDLRNQALCRWPIVQVANNRPADDNTGTAGHPLQRPQQPEVFDACRQHAAGRGQRKEGDRDENHPPPAQGIRDRAMPERHQRERQQVRGQRLLDLQGRGVERRADVVKRR